MSQEIQEAVYKQQEVIKDKQLSVKQDLDQVEPAVIEAQNGIVILVHLFISVFKKKKKFKFKIILSVIWCHKTSRVSTAALGLLCRLC